ncbi:hypothetical protein [Pantoea agglomerans]|uniref:hypothetical protein n=1 Tax=Enterobacter agglomerans TaxID=549 RepID=UPI0021D7BFE0|nr:hypothetical protein [Pantoea agglomerans]
MKNGAANVRFVPKADIVNIGIYSSVERVLHRIVMQPHRNRQRRFFTELTGLSVLAANSLLQKLAGGTFVWVTKVIKVNHAGCIISLIMQLVGLSASGDLIFYIQAPWTLYMASPGA